MSAVPGSPWGKGPGAKPGWKCGKPGLAQPLSGSLGDLTPSILLGQLRGFQEKLEEWLAPNSSLSVGFFLWGLNCTCRQGNFWYQFIRIRQRLGSRLECHSSVETTATATCSRENICLGAVWDLLYLSKETGDEHCIQILSNLVLLYYPLLRNEHLVYSFLPLKRSGGAACGHISTQVIIIFCLPLLCLQFQLGKKTSLCAFSCSSESCGIFCRRGGLCAGARLPVVPVPLLCKKKTSFQTAPGPS